KRFTRKLKILSCCRLSPIHEGIGPDNKFSLTSNVTKLVQFFNVSGSSPIKLLFRKTRDFKLTRVSMDSGIFPDNLLLLKSRTFNEL
ncbi:hypothetical protein GYH30_045329, partial [Glycine max]